MRLSRLSPFQREGKCTGSGSAQCSHSRERAHSRLSHLFFTQLFPYCPHHEAWSTLNTPWLLLLTPTSHPPPVRFLVLPQRCFLTTPQLSRVTGGLFPGILKEATRLTRLTLQHAAVVGGPDALTGGFACVVWGLWRRCWWR